MTFNLSLPSLILDIEIEYYQIMSTIIQLQRKSALRSFEQNKTNLQNTSDSHSHLVGATA